MLSIKRTTERSRSPAESGMSRHTKFTVRIQRLTDSGVSLHGNADVIVLISRRSSCAVVGDTAHVVMSHLDLDYTIAHL